MRLSLIDPAEEQRIADFKHLVETESIIQLNQKINQLVMAGWELRSVKRIEHADDSESWHALLKRDVLVS